METSEPHIDEGQMREFRAMFDRFDANSDGKLSGEELKQVFR